MSYEQAVQDNIRFLQDLLHEIARDDFRNVPGTLETLQEPNLYCGPFLNVLKMLVQELFKLIQDTRSLTQPRVDVAIQITQTIMETGEEAFGHETTGDIKEILEAFQEMKRVGSGTTLNAARDVARSGRGHDHATGDWPAVAGGRGRKEAAEGGECVKEEPEDDEGYPSFPFMKRPSNRSSKRRAIVDSEDELVNTQPPAKKTSRSRNNLGAGSDTRAVTSEIPKRSADNYSRVNTDAQTSHNSGSGMSQSANMTGQQAPTGWTTTIRAFLPQGPRDIVLPLSESEYTVGVHQSSDIRLPTRQEAAAFVRFAEARRITPLSRLDDKHMGSKKHLLSAFLYRQKDKPEKVISLSYSVVDAAHETLIINGVGHYVQIVLARVALAHRPDAYEKFRKVFPDTRQLNKIARQMGDRERAGTACDELVKLMGGSLDVEVGLGGAGWGDWRGRAEDVDGSIWKPLYRCLQTLLRTAEKAPSLWVKIDDTYKQIARLCQRAQGGNMAQTSLACLIQQSSAKAKQFSSLAPPFVPPPSRPGGDSIAPPALVPLTAGAGQAPPVVSDPQKDVNTSGSQRRGDPRLIGRPAPIPVEATPSGPPTVGEAPAIEERINVKEEAAPLQQSAPPEVMVDQSVDVDGLSLPESYSPEQSAGEDIDSGKADQYINGTEATTAQDSQTGESPEPDLPETKNDQDEQNPEPAPPAEQGEDSRGSILSLVPYSAPAYESSPERSLGSLAVLSAAPPIHNRDTLLGASAVHADLPSDNSAERQSLVLYKARLKGRPVSPKPATLTQHPSQPSFLNIGEKPKGVKWVDAAPSTRQSEEGFAPRLSLDGLESAAPKESPGCLSGLHEPEAVPASLPPQTAVDPPLNTTKRCSGSPSYMGSGPIIVPTCQSHLSDHSQLALLQLIPRRSTSRGNSAAAQVESPPASPSGCRPSALAHYDPYVGLRGQAQAHSDTRPLTPKSMTPQKSIEGSGAPIPSWTGVKDLLPGGWVSVPSASYTELTFEVSQADWMRTTMSGYIAPDTPLNELPIAFVVVLRRARGVADGSLYHDLFRLLVNETNLQRRWFRGEIPVQQAVVITGLVKPGGNTLCMPLLEGVSVPDDLQISVQACSALTQSYIFDRARSRIAPPRRSAQLARRYYLLQHEVLSLKDPITGDLIKVPARGLMCQHVNVFDLETFIKANAGSCSWLCPVSNCGIELSPLALETDPWLLEALGNPDIAQEGHVLTIGWDNDQPQGPVTSSHVSRSDDNGESRPVRRMIELASCTEEEIKPTIPAHAAVPATGPPEP